MSNPLHYGDVGAAVMVKRKPIAQNPAKPG
jgi:hypothetical protein